MTVAKETIAYKVRILQRSTGVSKDPSLRVPGGDIPLNTSLMKSLLRALLGTSRTIQHSQGGHRGEREDATDAAAGTATVATTLTISLEATTCCDCVP